MSKHRVKAVALDGEFDGYDEDYEEEEDGGLTAEDKEQLAAGTVAVRAELGEGFPATDKDIQDSLWHYYYDIAKTVAYLKNKQSSVTSKTKKKQDQTPSKRSPDIVPALAETLESVMAACTCPDLPMAAYDCPEQSAVGISCPEQFDAKSFFDGVPWLNIPPSRQALMFAQLVPQQRGLLGGSAKGEKMSKLAALAAKRRQKENAPPVLADQCLPTATDDYASSLRALRLSTSAPPKDKRITSLNHVDATSRESSTGQDSEIHSGKESKAGITDTQVPKSPFEPKELTARPSPFANTILGSGTSTQTPSIASSIEHSLFSSQAQGFDFAVPSPDDVVTKAQAAKVHSAVKSATKQPKKLKADPGHGVDKLSISEPVKIKSKNIDVVAEYGKVKRKNAANFVVIGHVDAGKSTLMGRLLFDLEAIDQRTMDKYRREAENIGKGSFAFAWVLDQGSEERARGVTIDIASNNFETEKTKFTILDAPGHRDFVPNMIAGASQADFAVLVIDASTGNFESGLKGQTKEHALLVRSIGVQRVIVAVNKMDAANWSQARFAEIRQQMSSFLTTAGFQSKNVAFVPCSGLQGDNILHKSKNEKASWYHGDSLVEELEKSEPNTYALDKPLRMTIGDVFRGGIQNPLSVSGRLEAGTVQIGEQIVFMPSGEKAYIKSLEVDDEPQDWAVAGQNVVLNLTDIDPIHIKTGDVLCSTASPIRNVTQITAKVLAFDHLTPMNVDVHRGRLNIPGRISLLVSTLDKASGAVIKKKPKIVQPGSLVRVVVTLEQAVPLESPSRIVLRNGGETVGTGLIEK